MKKYMSGILSGTIVAFPVFGQPVAEKPIAPGELRCFQIYPGDAACFYNAPAEGPVAFKVKAEVVRDNGDVNPKGGLWMFFGKRDATVIRGKLKWQPGLQQCDFIKNPGWNNNNSVIMNGTCVRDLKKGVVYEFEATAGVDPGGSGFVRASDISVSEKK